MWITFAYNYNNECSYILYENSQKNKTKTNFITVPCIGHFCHIIIASYFSHASIQSAWLQLEYNGKWSLWVVIQKQNHCCWWHHSYSFPFTFTQHTHFTFSEVRSRICLLVEKYIHMIYNKKSTMTSHKLIDEAHQVLSFDPIQRIWPLSLATYVFPVLYSTSAACSYWCVFLGNR